MPARICKYNPGLKTPNLSYQQNPELGSEQMSIGSKSEGSKDEEMLKNAILQLMAYPDQKRGSSRRVPAALFEAGCPL